MKFRHLFEGKDMHFADLQGSVEGVGWRKRIDREHLAVYSHPFHRHFLNLSMSKYDHLGKASLDAGYVWNADDGSQ